MRSIADGRRAAVQAGEHEVAGLGRGERQRDGLGIAHLADEQHVGIFAQRVAQAGREVAHVAPDLPLAHERGAAARGDGVFDGILERDDHAAAAARGFAGQRRQRRALAGAGRPADEDEPVR